MRSVAALFRRAAVSVLFAALLGLSPAQAAPKYCDTERDNVVIYIDTTTPYDEIDKQALVDGVSRIFESLEGGERFSVRTIADSFPTSRSLIDACVPFCKSNGFFEDLLNASCTEGVMLNDRKHLSNEVVRQLESLLRDFVELPYSEIVRTVALSSQTEWRSQQRNRLYLFTDLIENSAYLPGKDFFSVKNDKLLGRLKDDGLIPPLSGADVRVFGVGRGGNPGDRHPLDQNLLGKLTDFWTRYFDAAGASLSIQQSLGAVD